jgi:hypothetical protein
LGITSLPYTFDFPVLSLPVTYFPIPAASGILWERRGNVWEWRGNGFDAVQPWLSLQMM